MLLGIAVIVVALVIVAMGVYEYYSIVYGGTEDADLGFGDEKHTK